MWFIIFCVFTAGFSNVMSMTDQEVKLCFTKLVMKCTITHHVDMSELLNLQMLKVPTKNETKCLLACAYKANGMLNNATGLYDVDIALKSAEKIGEDDKKRVESGKKVVELCSKVNEEPVADGINGCDRAALLFKCLVQTAPEHGFKL